MKYIPMNIGGVVGVEVCKECGAFVWLSRQHDVWHEAIDNFSGSVQEAIEKLAEAVKEEPQ